MGKSGTGTSCSRSHGHGSNRMDNIRQKYAALRWNLVGKHYHQRVLQFLQELQFITFGQIVLAIPLLVFLIGGSITIFVNPNTTLSGNYAFYCLILTFLFAFKTNSIFRLVFGLSWTKLVALHHLSTVCCLVLTVGHAYVAFTGQDYIQPEECVPGYVAPTEEEYSEVDGPRRLLTQSNNQRPRFTVLCLEENPKYRYSLISLEPDLWAFLWDGGRNKSGTLMTICLLGLLSLSSLRFIRQHAYEFWLVLHISLAGAMLAYSDKHRIGMLVWILVVWWGLDGLVRYAWGMIGVNPKKATITKILPEVVEISFPRGKFSFQGGQFVRIAFPKTTHPVMFHPLTLSSAPYEEITTLHFRAVGGWTKYLADLCPGVVDRNTLNSEQRKTNKRKKKPAKEGALALPLSSTEVNILIEGPYGSLDVDLWDNHTRYPTVVLICAGIGVTPMLSIARQLLFEHSHQRKTRRKVHLVWAMRDLSLAQALMPLIAMPQALKPLIQLADSYDDDDDEEDEGLVGKKRTRKAGWVAAATADDSIEDPDLGFEAWFHPGTLKSSSSESYSPVPSIFCGDIYLTTKSIDGRSSSQGTLTDDDVTLKLCHEEGFTVQSGRRPDVHSILASTAAEATALASDVEERVAVICCGPASLTQDTKTACVSHSRPGIVMLDFHEEIFNY